MMEEENIIEKKACTKCGVEKDLCEFRKRSGCEGKYISWCKACESDNDKKYYRNNKEKIRERKKKHYNSHKEDNKQRSKIYAIKNKEKLKEQKRQYYFENKEKVDKRHKEYILKNPDYVKRNSKKRYERHKDKINKRNKLYVKNNKDKVRKSKRDYRKKRMASDFSYKIRKNISTKIYQFLKKEGYSKNGVSILKYLPYAIDQLKSHLESLFGPWMTWDNWGRYDPNTWDDNNPLTWTWQIDHIIPHSFFHYTSMDCEEFRKCWALENLRPYSAKQNNIDGNRRPVNVPETNKVENGK